MVVPYELTHATYARPILRFLSRTFGRTILLTFQERVFPDLSEDTLLLLAEDRGGSDGVLAWRDIPSARDLVALGSALADGNGKGLQRLDPVAICGGTERLIRYVLPPSVRELYDCLTRRKQVARLGDVADVGIGYVSGANEFFHLSPAAAAEWGIARRHLRPAVRRGRVLRGLQFSKGDWRAALPSGGTGYLLHVGREVTPDSRLAQYLSEGERQGVPEAYKCRVRSPWYRVPHVRVPDAFLTYMNGRNPRLVANQAKAVAPNNLHMVTLHPMSGLKGTDLAALWCNSLTRLSAEIEGHALGGGMLKLEPSEARNVCLPVPQGLDLCCLAKEMDKLCRQGKVSEATHLGDREILTRGLDLSKRQVASLAEGAEVLLQRRYHRGRKARHAV